MSLDTRLFTSPVPANETTQLILKNWRHFNHFIGHPITFPMKVTEKRPVTFWVPQFYCTSIRHRYNYWEYDLHPRFTWIKWHPPTVVEILCLSLFIQQVKAFHSLKDCVSNNIQVYVIYCSHFLYSFNWGLINSVLGWL